MVGELRRHPEPNVFGDAGQLGELHCRQLAQPHNDLLDELCGRRCTGCDADGGGTLDPGGVERSRVLDQITRHAALGGDLAEPVRVGTVRRADNQYNVDKIGEFPCRSLTILRCVANVLRVGSDDRREAGLQRFDDGTCIIDAQGRLSDKGEFVGVGNLETRYLLGGRDQMHAAVDPPHRTDDFRMPGMAYQDDLAALVRIALTLDVYLGNERAGGVDDREPPVSRTFLDHFGDPVGAEYRDAALRDLVDLVDKMRALGAQPLDDVTIVNDFVTDEDRRAIFFESALDDLDRALDAGAEASWLG